MGWKTLKEKYEIKHTVQVDGNAILIGSGFVSGLVAINMDTGYVSENKTFSSFLREQYPALAAASQGEVLAAIQAEDVFEKSIPVFTYKNDGTIVKKYCEELGYPNVTHDGQLMYENRFSDDLGTVIYWAKKEAEARVDHSNDAISRIKDDLEEWHEKHAERVAALEKLNTDYPHDSDLNTPR